MGKGENLGWQGKGRSVMKRRKIKPVNRSIEATAYIQIHRRKTQGDNHFLGKAQA